MESGHVADLSRCRLERAGEMLRSAERGLETKHFATSFDRSYYAVFHAMRAANSLYIFDSKRQSGVIGFFTKTFLKENRIGNNKEMSKTIADTRLYQKRSNYQDFFVATEADAKTQFENAKRFVTAVSEFLTEYLDE